MSLYKGVAYEDSVFVAYEYFFLGKNYASHAVCHAGNALAVKLTYILVPVGAVDAATVAVKAEVERCAVLYHGFVEARQQHVRLVAHSFYRYHQQSVLFAGVASGQGGAVVCTHAVSAEHLLRQRLFQVYEQILIEFKITHFGFRLVRYGVVMRILVVKRSRPHHAVWPPASIIRRIYAFFPALPSHRGIFLQNLPKNNFCAGCHAKKTFPGVFSAPGKVG